MGRVNSTFFKVDEKAIIRNQYNRSPHPIAEEHIKIGCHK